MTFKIDMTGMETITQPLYDTQPYSKHVNFFSEPVGYKSRTTADTNMWLTNQLPRGLIFVMKGITLEFLSSRPAYGADERKFHSGGHCRFVIGSKDYLVTTAGDLSNYKKQPHYTLSFNSADGQVSTTFTTEDDETACSLSPNDLLLVGEQYFRLALYDLPALRYPARIRARLTGELMRPVA